MCHGENGIEDARSVSYLNILSIWCFSYALFKTLCIVV
jgi:hypothetical protein